MRIFYHQSGDTTGGRVQRRTDRYGQEDNRGQYPRPRNNQFASQPRPRAAARPQRPMQEALQREVPKVDMYTENGVQYQKPVKPYVPEYMKNEQQAQKAENHAFDMPLQQADYIAKQNPYMVMSEKNADKTPRVGRRMQIVLVAAALVILAGVWIGQMAFAAQTELIYDQREAQAAALADNHPYNYRDLIEQQAYANNLHPAFVAGIILNESSFNPYAENSSTGARGLMQMMEDTALWVYESIGMGTTYSYDLMFEAQSNVEYGCWYLSYLSEKFHGDPILVAAAFHSGQTNVLNWLSNQAYSSDGQTIAMENFPEGNTKVYVQRVLNAFAVYRRLYYEEVTL